jgi:hypothetical protein
MHNWLPTASQALEAVASLVAGLFAILSWRLLRTYVSDTSSIARVSVQQLEEANRPVLIAKKTQAYANGYQVWLLENVGSGPAINIEYLRAIGRKGKPIHGQLLGLAIGKEIEINLGPDNAFDDDVADIPDELIIEYSSIRGKRHRSTVTTGSPPTTKFEELSMQLNSKAR